MKITILKITILFFLLMSLTLFAQNFQGKAYYQTKNNIEMKIEGSKMGAQQQKIMQEILKKQSEKIYVLTFNKEESIYKEEEQLDNPTGVSSGGIQFFMSGGSGQEVYKNIKTKTFLDEKDVFEKAFLVKGVLETFNWKLGDESKIIGKYLCFKATANQEVTSISMRFRSDKDKKQKKPVSKTETKIITAWYTTDIPVSNGPDKYWGLPGLILELNDGNKMQYVCTKIVMNTKGKIEAPTKGKVVSEDEFEKIMNKKIKEMMEVFHGGKGRKGGDGISFKIGG